ncbi:MAG TPA: hypothetical protein VGC56_07180 [Allosphingosinicella sp.]
MRVPPRKLKEGAVRVPLSQKLVAGIDLHSQLRDPSFRPDRTRLVPRGEELPVADERLTSMGEMIMEADGGSLRTFSGKLAHENGWWPGWKRQRLQHWEGTTQRSALLAAECDFAVAWAQSEPCLLRFPIGDQWYEWYADLLVNRVDGPDELWEIKKDERQLEDSTYRLKLACADEICRRIGMRFRLVMAEEIVENRHHRDNLETFAGRRFVTMTPEQIRRFEGFAVNRGTETTYGELANVIDPRCPARGAAVVQGLTVRRRVEIDLRKLLTNCTPLRIH